MSVAILLSTYNGERFLAEQLDSFLAQTHANWMLYWRVAHAAQLPDPARRRP
jgi:glycosyltransferase involved in cell wall biosynthesis